MLKAEVNNKHISLEIVGDVYRICADISHIISTANDKISKSDPKLGHYFRVLFTKGFMDGVCFEDDREHMNHYLAEGDEMFDKSEEKEDVADNKKEDFADFLDGFIGFLKNKRNELEKDNEILKKRMEEEEHRDEAE